MEAPPAQLEREIKCELCGRKFHNKANVRRHKRLNRCSVLQQNRDQQRGSHQQTPTPEREQQPPPQPRSRLQSQQLLSMTHPQRIEWLNECMKNNEQLSQSLVQVVLAIEKAGPIHLPAAVGGNNAGNEVGTVPGTSQQQQRENRIESDEE